MAGDVRVEAAGLMARYAVDALPIVSASGHPVALLTALSGAAYLTAWLRHMAEEPHEDRKP